MMNVRWSPIQIAENRRKSRARACCGGQHGILVAFAADTYRQKSLNCREKRRLRRISELQLDL
jgi:hypothetical protein